MAEHECCGMSFETEDELKKHLAEAHGEEAE